MTAPGTNDATQRAEPESLRGRELMVSMTVKDMDKSLAWYCDVLGFTVQQKHERDGKLVACSLKAGTVQILIGQDDGKKGWDRVKGEGTSFQITTAQDVDGIAERIKGAGGVLESEPMTMPWGSRSFRLVDPDGFKIVISSIRPGE